MSFIMGEVGGVAYAKDPIFFVSKTQFGHSMDAVEQLPVVPIYG
jgi:hypothetical protein